MPRMSASAGRRCARSCSPASVGDTLRVVRVSSRMPICSSRRRIAWLRPDVEMFNCFAARVKLRSSATARKAERTLSSSRMIVHSPSRILPDCIGLTPGPYALIVDSASTALADLAVYTVGAAPRTLIRRAR